MISIRYILYYIFGGGVIPMYKKEASKEPCSSMCVELAAVCMYNNKVNKCLVFFLFVSLLL